MSLMRLFPAHARNDIDERGHRSDIANTMHPNGQIPDATIPAPKSTPATPLSLAGLRILHVFDHSLPIHSGYSFRSASLIREQRRRGWHTFHLTTPKHTHRGPPTETIAGLSFERTPALPRVIRNIPILSEIALIGSVAHRIRQFVDTVPVDVLHAHSPVLNALACLRAGRRLGLPVVYEVRGFWEDAAVSHGTAVDGGFRYRVTRALETHALMKCDSVATICEGLRNDMLARGLGADRITVIPNGVDVDEFPFGAPKNTVLQKSLNLDGCVVLGFIGSFYEYEGLDLLLAALPSVTRTQPNVVIVLVGEGPAENALKAQAGRLGIEGAVRFIGRVPHDRVVDYYGLIDIFVYPRYPMRLTEIVTPLKPLEAMAYGGVVLASNVGGHREIVRHEQTGYLFPAGDASACATSILETLARRLDWQRIRGDARHFVERERTWSKAATGYEELYRRALLNHR